MIPKRRWQHLIKQTIEQIGIIDNDTEWQESEPEWWLDMMEVQQLLIEKRVTAVGERDEPQKPRTTFAARLAERIAELEAEREQAKGDARLTINGQIGLIRAIAHDYSEATNG